MIAPVAPQTIADARAIVANPSPNHTPLLRRMAYAIILSERGSRMRQATLPRPSAPYAPGTYRDHTDEIAAAIADPSMWSDARAT